MAESKVFTSYPGIKSVSTGQPNIGEGRVREKHCNSTTGEIFTNVGGGGWVGTQGTKLLSIASATNPDLLAMWTGDNISGSTLVDDSPIGRNGTINGVSVAAGVKGNALDFPGTGDIDVGAGPDLLSGDMSYCFFLRPDDVATFQGVMGRGPTSSGGLYYGMMISIQADGTLAFDRGRGQNSTVTSNYRVSSNSLLKAAAFVFVTITYNGTTGDTEIFFNAVSDATGNLGVGDITFNAADPGTWHLGQRGRTGSEFYLDGLLDEFRIFKKVLSLDEIRTLYFDAVTKQAILYGDSITVGVGATSYATSWGGQWEALKQATSFTINAATSGDQAAEMSNTIQTYPPTTPTSEYTVMIGTNDHRTYKTDGAKQLLFEKFFRQSLAWLALPDKTLARDAGMLETGVWSDTGANTIGRVTTQNGATATATVNGTGVYIGHIIQNSLSSEGTAEVRIDGNLVGTISTFGVVDTVNGSTFAAAASYFGGLANTAHTVEVTVTSTGENFYLDYIAGSPQTPPSIKASNIIKMSASAYTTYGTSEANVITYNGIIDTVLGEFTADGVTIDKIDNFTSIDPATHLDPDGVHPNDSGHSVIYTNFTN